MKFGETFKEYLHGDQEWFLDKFSHVEYKRLKKVLKSCRTCKALPDCKPKTDQQRDDEENPTLSQYCQCQSCPGEFFTFFLLFFLPNIEFFLLSCFLQLVHYVLCISTNQFDYTEPAKSRMESWDN